MLRPLNDNVILKKDKALNRTASGIVLSTHEKDEEVVATVVAVGPGKYEDGKLVKIDLKCNDKVIFKKYSATNISYNDEELLVVSAKDIIAVIE